jgi:hypothetical protein
MLSRARIRAKALGVPCMITKDDVIIPEVCPVFGTKLVVGGERKTSPSIDRIDNTKGYVPGNVQVISHLANVMKNSATVEELATFARWVLMEAL